MVNDSILGHSQMLVILIRKTQFLFLNSELGMPVLDVFILYFNNVLLVLVNDC
mgnify:FL=1